MTGFLNLHDARLEEELRFERERLSILITSKIRRNEIVGAQEVAGELFRTETEFDLRRKTQLFIRYNRLLRSVMIFFLGISFGAVFFMVLNISPAVCLMVQAVAALCLILAIGFNAYLMGRYGKALRTIIEAYESTKPSFVKRILDRLVNQKGPGDLSTL